MVNNDNDSNGDGIPEGTGRVLFYGGAVVGGFFLLRGLLDSGKEERLRQLEKSINRTQTDIRSEVDNANETSDGELRSHIQNYKALAKSLNNTIPSDRRLDLSQLEQELKGESLATRSLQWKTVALQLLYYEYGRVGGQSELSRLLSQAPGWVKTLLSIAFVTITTAATISILKRLLDFGRGGGGLGQLNDFSSWVRNGIFGSPDVLDDIEAPPDPDEKPTTVTEPAPDPTEPPERIITGSPRSAAEDAGLGDDILAELLAILGITAVVPIAIGERTVDAIASVTDKDSDFYYSNPEIAIVIVIAIAAAAIVAGGTEGLGTPVAVALLAAVGAAVGVKFVDIDEVVNVGSDVRQRERELM